MFSNWANRAMPFALMSRCPIDLKESDVLLNGAPCVLFSRCSDKSWFDQKMLQQPAPNKILELCHIGMTGMATERGSPTPPRRKCTMQPHSSRRRPAYPFMRMCWTTVRTGLNNVSIGLLRYLNKFWLTLAPFLQCAGLLEQASTPQTWGSHVWGSENLVII